MPRGISILTSYADEIGRDATVTLEDGAAMDGYDVDRLIDDEPDGLFKSPDTDVTIRFDLGAKTPIALVALIHATPLAADDVSIRFDDSPGGTAIDVPFGQPGWLGRGAGRYPANGFIDTEEIDGFDALGYRYIDLVFSSLAEPLEIGAIKIYSSLTRVPLSRSLKEGATKPDIEHRTATGVAYIYPHGSTQWTAEFEFGGLEPADLAVLEAQWYEQSGRGLPFVFAPSDAVNRCYFSRFSGVKMVRNYETSNQIAVPTGLEELSRGLRPGA